MRKKIDSNHCNAVILSYVGRRHEICQLYQVLNHDARTYIFDVRGHPGFLVGYEKSIKAWVERKNGGQDGFIGRLLKEENTVFEESLKT